MLMNLYGNADDFWTSDDEKDDNESEQDESEDETSNTVNPASPLTSEALSLVYQQILHEKDTVGDGDQEVYLEGKGEIPHVSILPPTEKAIRKSWVIHDTVSTNRFNEEVPEPALRFPFELDDFQKRAIRHVHRREYTFVAAHTSAGKTVVAEYAIALAKSRGRRAVYTSPIKALSNQKFRDFKQKFDSVGIITGDVSVNPSAQCLIATTEILRTMLYRGDPILNQLDVVIFDEVHYVNDVERGVVWEEVIIMLPRDVCLVMLSATVPNFKEFADWIGRTKHREVFAISTLKRPTPLKHFLWVDDKEFLLMEQNKYRAEAFNEVYQHRRESAKKDAASRSKTSGKGPVGTGRSAFAGGSGGSNAKQKSDSQRLQSLIKKLESNNQLPVVVFCFSRKRCESFPSSMSKLDLLSQDDRSKVHLVVKDSFSSLSEVDRVLPQVELVTGFLNRGIGVHHGGLLPIVKECVEILFQKGLVRVLIATETFAMGVNMPARSVIFTSIEKHDGQKLRPLLSSEYTQMAGRAGRRGIDLFGSVYILCSADLLPDTKDMSKMLAEKANQLQSQFKLTYEMLLQLASHRSIKVEDMMSLSFREYSRAQRIPTLKRDQKRVLKELDSIEAIDCIYGDPTLINRYLSLEMSSRKLSTQLHNTLWRHQYSLLSNRSDSVSPVKLSPFCAGRVVGVHSLPISQCTCIATILGFADQPASPNATPAFHILALSTNAPVNKAKKNDTFYEDDLLRRPQVKKLINDSKNPYRLEVLKSGFLRSSISDNYSPGASLCYYFIESVPLEAIGLVTNSALDFTPSTSGSPLGDTELLLVAKALDRLNIEAQGKWQPLILSKHLKQVEIEFFDTLLQERELVTKLNSVACHSCSLKEKHFQTAKHKKDCERTAKEIELSLRVESLELYDEMKLKYQILQRRQFVDESGSITLKGQVAAAITTNDAITLTEALFAGVFQDLTAAEAVAALSAFVFPDKSDDAPSGPTQPLADAREKIEKIHDALAKEMKVFRIHVVHEQWWKLCNFGLAFVAYQWAEGKSFGEIMQTTEIQEGTIVRSILRLDELIRKIRIVAKTLLDDSKLESLMNEASKRIHRNIIFTVSLYLQ